MRVAHARSPPGHPSIGRCSVSTSSRQRDLLPIQHRRAHIDTRSGRLPHPRPQEPRARSGASAARPRAHPSAGSRECSAWRSRRPPSVRPIRIVEREPDRRRSSSSTTASWSNPTPRCRSPSARASAGVTTVPDARRHRQRQSRCPSPCIFMKARPCCAHVHDPYNHPYRPSHTPASRPIGSRKHLKAPTRLPT